MKIKNNLDHVMHRIRCKLYPSYLSNSKGEYIARTNSEASLSVEQVCTALKNRGGFTGNYDDLVAHVNQYFDETAYHLCDGFAVNMRYFSVAPNVGGTFDSTGKPNGRKERPVGFSFRPSVLLRELAGQIVIDIEGVFDGSGYIDKFTDLDGQYENSTIAQGNMFRIEGSKIKIAGDDPGIGVYFVAVDDPSKAVRVERIGENKPSKIIGVAPELPSRQSRIEIRTQFSGASKLLKTMRVIKSDFIIEAA